MNWKKHKLPALLMLMIVVYSCASMGTPDGGPYDEEPPKFVRSSPKPYATNNKDKKIAIEFDEFIKLEKANEKVVADRGRVAVERGPIVYCAEWADNDFNIQNIILNRHPKFQVTEKPELLYGINEITTEVQALGFDAAGKLATRDVTLTLIPYYAWAHRGEGKMDVWLPVNRIDVE